MHAKFILLHLKNVFEYVKVSHRKIFFRTSLKIKNLILINSEFNYFLLTFKTISYACIMSLVTAILILYRVFKMLEVLNYSKRWIFLPRNGNIIKFLKFRKQIIFLLLLLREFSNSISQHSDIFAKSILSLDA